MTFYFSNCWERFRAFDVVLFSSDIPSWNTDCHITGFSQQIRNWNQFVVALNDNFFLFVRRFDNWIKKRTKLSFYWRIRWWRNFNAFGGVNLGIRRLENWIFFDFFDWILFAPGVRTEFVHEKAPKKTCKALSSFLKDLACVLKVYQSF